MKNVTSAPQRFLLIKCGGSIINDNVELTILLNNIALLKQHGFSIVIVHGGGPDITRLCNELKVASSFVNGQRVTSLEVLAVTQMALLGQINCNLVHKLNMAGVSAIGLSGHDANLLIADFINREELGYVGRIKRVNADLIHSILKLGLTPVIAPIGVDAIGNSYNINADLVAADVACALLVDKLILLSDIDGFYLDSADKNSKVSQLSSQQIQQMLCAGTISGGMIPKLMACERAVCGGVPSAHIINGRNPEGMVSLAHDIAAIGTTIIRE